VVTRVDMRVVDDMGGGWREERTSGVRTSGSRLWAPGSRLQHRTRRLLAVQ
jgi:hypothetical protein